jgi:chromosomal replication initiation ATPase DnaA
MDKTSDEVWDKCLKVIKDNVNAQSFRTWFEPIKPVKLASSGTKPIFLRVARGALYQPA